MDNLMKTIAIIAQKGGVGKTTLAVHLAFAAAMNKKAVLLIDLDPQATGIEWVQEREKENELVAVSATAPELEGYLKRAKKAADLVIIDTAPHSSREAAEAARLADFVLVPCGASKGDMKTIPSTLDIIGRNRKPYRIILNRVPPVGGRGEHIQELMKAQGFHVLDKMLPRRVAFDYCNDDGRTVFEYEPEGKAAVEMKELYVVISDILKL